MRLTIGLLALSLFACGDSESEGVDGLWSLAMTWPTSSGICSVADHAVVTGGKASWAGTSADPCLNDPGTNNQHGHIGLELRLDAELISGTAMLRCARTPDSCGQNDNLTIAGVCSDSSCAATANTASGTAQLALERD
jgi:hypothetical protein